MNRRFRVLVAAAVGLTGTTAIATFAPGVAHADTPVFINEIHYDNASTDTGEFVEVAGPAGTDLTGWSIVPYNGNGGAAYTPVGTLSGTIDDEGGGYGAVSVAIAGLQNGAPDGVALVNGTTVVQFLSYEGTFTAVGGPANGMTSVDIGVSQAGTEAVGSSLHLTGTGTIYESFTWAASSDDTPGAINVDQTFGSVQPVAPTVDAATPADTTITSGSSTTLSVTVITGTQPFSYQWYQGTAGDTSTPVGTDSSIFTTPALTATTSYWVRVSNSEGSADSRAATVTVTAVSLTPIGAVQGTTDTSPFVGQSVTIEGIVVGDYEGPCPSGTQPPDTACTLRGFYVQSRDAAHDTDALTSEAVFVFHGSEDTVDVGDEVRVTGVVAEFQGQTQLGFPSALEELSAASAVTPTVVALPMTSATQFEAYEGMLVTFEQTLYVTETFHMARSGEVRVSSGDRRDQPTAVVEPGPGAIALQAANNLNYLIIDDATNTQNPDPYVYAADGGQLTASNTLRGGDTVTGATGVMTFGWAGFNATGNGNAYRVRPQSEVPAHIAEIPFVTANPRPTQPPDVGGSLNIVGFNVLNYFRTLDTTNSAPFPCGPIGFKQECRGANSAFELQRQHDKLIAALLNIDADVYGFAELENSQLADGTVVDPLGPIVDALNAAVGDDVWTAVDTGIIGTDTIRVGLMYRSDKVELAGNFAVMDSTSFPEFDDDNNRPSLAVPLRELATGGELTVVVNHWKSKGSCPTNPADPQFPGNNDTGDGSSCWNAARVNAAESLLDWLATNPTGLVDDDVLVFGDLNSYAKEAPIDVMLNAGYVDAVQHFTPGAYSFVFDGQWGTLDYALASPSLAEQLTGAADYHISADEPPGLDYNTDFKTANNVQILYAPDQYRTSDHDPAIVGMALDSDIVTVTVEQAAGQRDPAALRSDVRFTVTFSEPVTGFGPEDLLASGGGVAPVISGSGQTYTVTFPKVRMLGPITLSVRAGAVTDADGNVSLASTSTDNTVFVAPPGVSKR